MYVLCGILYLCDLILLAFLHKKIHLLLSVFVIKHLSKYTLPFPRMHFKRWQLWQLCYLLSQQSVKKNRLHTVSSYTLISVASHAKTSHESLWSDHINRGRSSTLTLLIVYRVTFLLNVHSVLVKGFKEYQKHLCLNWAGNSHAFHRHPLSTILGSLGGLIWPQHFLM